jgi:hypothetical protein
VIGAFLRKCLGTISALVAVGVAVIALDGGAVTKPRLPNLKSAPDAIVQAGRAWQLKIELDAGWKINDTAPSRLRLLEDNVAQKTMKEFQTRDLKGVSSLDLPALRKGVAYRVQGSLYFCEEKNPSVCVVQSHDQVVRAEESGETALVVRVSR